MISVAIAAYNGEKYLHQQLMSILPQLGNNDEIIISDDNPKGATKASVDDLLNTDKRIKYIAGPQKGVIKNFENAINFSSGDYIFLCDQDDVWHENKVKTVLEAFKDDVLVVIHDAEITDAALNITNDSFMALNNSKSGILKNIIKNSYIGCCMAFKSDLKDYILPFPDKIPMHDQWIGIIGEAIGKTVIIKEPLIYYRRHDETVTGSSTTFVQKIKWRIDLISALIRCKVGV